MKVGDIVSVHDGSYSLSLVKGTMQHVSGTALQKRRFLVLGLRGVFPTDKSLSNFSGDNNILLVDVNDSDFVLFSQRRFCSVTTPLREIPSPILEIMVPRGAKELLLRFPSES